jgi:hypothetical protein
MGTTVAKKNLRCFHVFLGACSLLVGYTIVLLLVWTASVSRQAEADRMSAQAGG